MAMIEIRTYDGDGSDLIALASKAWRRGYGGRVWYPIWSRELIEWQFLSARPEGRFLLPAAYKGSRLVGFVFGDACTHSFAGRVLAGSRLGRLTVDPDLQLRGLGLQLVEELHRRHREMGVKLVVAAAIGGRRGPALPFWERYIARFPEKSCWGGNLTFWVNPLQPGAVAEAGIDRWEALLSRGLGWARPATDREVDPAGIDDYRVNDLDDCLRNLERLSAGMDFATVFDRESLARQLRYGGVPRTLVLRKERGVAGFLNYHSVDMRGRTTLSGAIIDLIAAPELDWSSQVRLLRCACRRMRQEGIQMVSTMGNASCRPQTMFAAGFVPVPKAARLLFFFPSGPLPRVRPKRYNFMLP